MNLIIQNYNLLVADYQQIEESLTETDLQKKRRILQSIFSILAAFGIKPSKLKNAEPAYKMLEKANDIQAQIQKLQETGNQSEVKEYLNYLIIRKQKLDEKWQKFIKRKKLRFPEIKKKKFDKANIYRKFDKCFYKLIDSLSIESVEDAEDVQNVQIRFNKFLAVVEVLSYTDKIDSTKLEKLKLYKDNFEEIQNFEVMIRNMKKFFRKTNSLDEISITESLELYQNVLIESFDNQKESLIHDCRAVILLK